MGNEPDEKDELDEHLIDAVNRMSGDAFKALVRTLLGSMGLKIISSEFDDKKGDIEAKAGEKIPFAEYPQYVIRFSRDGEITGPEELQGFVTNRKNKDTGMIFIDTTGFSEDAARYAKEFEIETVDNSSLAALLKKFDLLAEAMIYKDKEILDNEKGRFLPSIGELENILDLGNKAYAKGDFHEALGYFTKATELKSNYDVAWYMRGVTLNNIEHYEEALKAFTKALEINIENENAWYNMGLVLYSLGRYDEEIECYDKAIELKKDFFNAWNNKGTTLLNKGRYEEANECYDEILGLDKNYKQAWNNKGIALKKLKKIKDALECLTKALTIDSNYIDAWLNKGLIHLDGKRYKDAYHCFNAALKIDEKNIQALYDKGRALEGVGQYTKAEECYETIIAIDPGFKAAHRRKKKAQEALEQKGDSDIEEDFFTIEEGMGSEYFIMPLGEERILVEKREGLLDESESEAASTEMPFAPPISQTVPLILEEGMSYKEGYECWGDYDDDDEGCIKCKVVEKCRQETELEENHEEPSVSPFPQTEPLIPEEGMSDKEGYECYGSFDDDDGGCLECSLKDKCRKANKD